MSVRHIVSIQGGGKVLGQCMKNDTPLLIFHQIIFFLKVDETLGPYLPKMYNMLELIFFSKFTTAILVMVGKAQKMRF